MAKHEAAPEMNPDAVVAQAMVAALAAKDYGAVAALNASRASGHGPGPNGNDPHGAGRMLEAQALDRMGVAEMRRDVQIAQTRAVTIDDVVGSAVDPATGDAFAFVCKLDLVDYGAPIEGVAGHKPGWIVTTIATRAAEKEEEIVARHRIGLADNVARALNCKIDDPRVEQTIRSKVVLKHEIAMTITIPIMRRCVGRNLRDLVKGGTLPADARVQELLDTGSDVGNAVPPADAAPALAAPTFAPSGVGAAELREQDRPRQGID